MLQTPADLARFVEDARRSRPGATVAVPMCVRLLGDQLTPVLAYRRLVAPDEREAPSFLLESVEGGERQGRYSILGARPVLEVVAYANRVRTIDHRNPGAGGERELADPLDELRRRSREMVLHVPAGAAVPGCVLGGWFGFAGYDSVRYTEPGMLPFSAAPRDDRGLPDLHFALYDGVVAFDHVDKLVYVVQLALVGPGADAGAEWARASAKLSERVEAIQRHVKPLPAGRVEADLSRRPAAAASNLSEGEHRAMIDRALGYIRAGDIFQVVVGQRFERRSAADPFDVYRALRVVNPSPYMVYMQCAGCILVASSPEILCRVRRAADGSMIVTNRPLAGTRRRGRDAAEDAALGRELLADPKERAEHIMLVDLGRNDLGRVCVPGSIRLPALMEIERYSHVMHISSTAEGRLRAGLDCWDALAATLPVGTISGAPKIRAMQIIDELEPVKRGPYGGGMGAVGLDGQMDIALALRTMVVPTGARFRDGGAWTYHLQAAGGIVADSDHRAEYEETVNKSAALGRAIDLAESAFPR